jgi:hypothetical protein
MPRGYFRGVRRFAMSDRSGIRVTSPPVWSDLRVTRYQLFFVSSGREVERVCRIFVDEHDVGIRTRVVLRRVSEIAVDE